MVPYVNKKGQKFLEKQDVVRLQLLVKKRMGIALLGSLMKE